MSDPPLRIATRASRLALWQAHHVRDLLAPLIPGRSIELVTVFSTGDAVRDRPLFQVGGVGVFTKEIQEAVLDGRADLAVHSLKDLPTETRDELVLAAVPERGPVADAFLSRDHASIIEVPAGSRVATSSLRRRAMLRRFRPDLAIVDVRGNVETRLRKLLDGEFEGMILALAGLKRLGLESHVREELPTELFLPAVGQGALGIECRADDDATRALLKTVDHPASRHAVVSERAFLRAMQGGCQAPIGALAHCEGDSLTLSGRALSPDGLMAFEGTKHGAVDRAESVGESLAQELLARGAAEILRG